MLLFLHGGGYQLGSLRSDGELAARLGRASGMRVLFPEYRLAPEHPFPAAVDDVRGRVAVAPHDQRLSAGSMAVAGDSAGGGPRRGSARGHPGRRRRVARGRRADVADGRPDQLGCVHDRARRPGPDLHAGLAPQLASDYLAGADPGRRWRRRCSRRCPAAAAAGAQVNGQDGSNQNVTVMLRILARNRATDPGPSRTSTG